MAVRGSLIVSFVEMMYFSGSSTASPSLTSSGPKVKLCTTPSSMYFWPLARGVCAARQGDKRAVAHHQKLVAAGSRVAVEHAVAMTSPFLSL